MKFNCKNCRTRFDSVYPTVYCSDQCKAEHKQPKKTPPKPKAKRFVKCVFCSKKIEAKNSEKRFCSSNCGQKYRKRKRKRRCNECKTLYLPQNKRQFHCSPQCKKVDTHRQIRAKRAKRKSIDLLRSCYCGQSFIGVNANQIYCSKLCSDRKSRQRQKQRKAKLCPV